MLIVVVVVVYAQIFIHDYMVLTGDTLQQGDPLSDPSPVLQQLRANAPVVEVTIPPDAKIKSAANYYN